MRKDNEATMHIMRAARRAKWPVVGSPEWRKLQEESLQVEIEELAERLLVAIYASSEDVGLDDAIRSAFNAAEAFIVERGRRRG